MNLIICDIDGTIANLDHRLHYIQDKNKKKLDKPDWKSFYDEVDKDEPIKAVVDFIFYQNPMCYKIVFLTGRNEICKEKTLTWLSDQIFEFEEEITLLMRQKDDRRPDTEVKPDLLKEYLKKYPDDEVSIILDDQTHMIDKWEELGYTTFQVRQGKINN